LDIFGSNVDGLTHTTVWYHFETALWNCTTFYF